MMLSPRPVGRLRLALRLIALVSIVYGFFWVSGFPRQYDDDELPPSQRLKAADPLVPHPVEFDQLVVSVKATAPDAWKDIPPLLLRTDGKYHNTLLLMGDLQMDIGAFHVHDVLDTYDANFVADNKELERYRRQLDYARDSIDLAKVKRENSREEKEALATLDKYKILRILERAWKYRPERRWYAFVEPDTYLVRSNLLSWLGQFDPSELIFFANPPALDLPDVNAMSGSTFILSEGAIRALMVDRPDVIPYYDARLADHSSAFDVLSTVLSMTLSLSYNKTWPGISGFGPSTIPYGPGFWCEQVMAMHSVPVDIASDVWRFERDREDHQHVKDPLLFADLWIHFMQPENLEDARDDWDNLSSEPEYGQWNILFEAVEHTSHRDRHKIGGARAKSGEESWKACRDSCDENDHCVQWSYSSVPSSNYNENSDTKCHLSRSMRFGAHVDPKEVDWEGEKVEQKWKSGWRKEKFQTWARQQRCKSQQN